MLSQRTPLSFQCNLSTHFPSRDTIPRSTDKSLCIAVLRHKLVYISHLPNPIVAPGKQTIHSEERVTEFGGFRSNYLNVERNFLFPAQFLLNHQRVF